MLTADYSHPSSVKEKNKSYYTSAVLVWLNDMNRATLQYINLLNFTFMWLCIVTNFFIIKPTICINFPNLLWHETLRVSGSFSAHHQEFIHRTLGTGICHTNLKTAFEQDQVLIESCLQTCMTYTSAECMVNKLLIMGRGTARNM